MGSVHSSPVSTAHTATLEAERSSAESTVLCQLSIDWPFFDKEFDTIVYAFTKRLLAVGLNEDSCEDDFAPKEVGGEHGMCGSNRGFNAGRPALPQILSQVPNGPNLCDVVTGLDLSRGSGTGAGTSTFHGAVTSGMASPRGSARELPVSVKMAVMFLEYREVSCLVDAMAYVLSGECRGRRFAVAATTIAATANADAAVVAGDVLTPGNSILVDHFRSHQGVTSGTRRNSGTMTGGSGTATVKATGRRFSGTQGGLSDIWCGHGHDTTTTSSGITQSMTADSAAGVGGAAGGAGGGCGGGGTLRYSNQSVVSSNSDNLSEEQLYRIQTQQAQRHRTVSSFGDQSYSNALLMSMSRRASSMGTVVTDLRKVSTPTLRLSADTLLCAQKARTLSFSSDAVLPVPAMAAEGGRDSAFSMLPMTSGGLGSGSGFSSASHGGGFYTNQQSSPRRSSKLDFSRRGGRGGGAGGVGQTIPSQLQRLSLYEVTQSLSCVFAHMQFSFEDVTAFVVLFADTVLDVQALALSSGGDTSAALATENILPIGRGGGGSGSVEVVLASAMRNSLLRQYNQVRSVLAFTAGCQLLIQQQSIPQPPHQRQHSVGVRSNSGSPNSTDLAASTNGVWWSTSASWRHDSTLRSSMGGGLEPAAIMSAPVIIHSGSQSSTPRYGGRGPSVEPRNGSSLLAVRSSLEGASFSYDVLCNQANIFFREHGNLLRSDLAPRCSHCLRDPLNEILVQESAYVIHYAVRVMAVPGTDGNEPAGTQERYVWRLCTRLLSLRQQFLYLYDGVATALSALGEDSSVLALAEHNTPIALINTARVSGGDLAILSGPDETEVLDLAPSMDKESYDSRREPEDVAGVHTIGGTRRGGSASPARVGMVCVRVDSGEVLALSVPASSAATYNQLISKPDVLSLQHSRRGTGGQKLESARGDIPGTADPPPLASMERGGASPRIGCALHPQHFARVRTSEQPLRIVVFPLRLFYKGIVHHFFFQSANTRASWYSRLTLLMTELQSRGHCEAIARAPKRIIAYVSSRICVPTGPSAFEYLTVLGTGSYGRVMLVRHRLTGRLFAMKILRKGSFTSLRNIVEVRRERRILESAKCPYIMKMHSAFQTESRVYILLDYLSGGELLMHTLNAPGRHFDESVARFFLAELAIAVEYLRVRGYMHRDIKGENLILDGDGHLVLADFGFAKRITLEPGIGGAYLADTLATGRVMRQHTSCGTVAYMAPELAGNARSSEGYDFEADWWSVGVVLFTMLTGFFPFLRSNQEETVRAITTSPLQFPEAPSISSEAKQVLFALLEKDPARRTATLAQLKGFPFFRGFDWDACVERRVPPPQLLHRNRYNRPSGNARNVGSELVAKLLLDPASPLAPTSLRGGCTGDISPRRPPHEPQVEGNMLPLLPPGIFVNPSRYVKEFQEEREEILLVEAAYGVDADPAPRRAENDVFGPLYDHQEVCGSDRDVEDDFLGDYIPVSESAVTTPLVSDGREIGGGAGGGRYIGSPKRACQYDAARSSLCADDADSDDGGGGGDGYEDSENEDAFVPITSDFDEAAYASITCIRSTRAELSSVAGFYRPVMRE